MLVGSGLIGGLFGLEIVVEISKLRFLSIEIIILQR